MSSDSSTNSTDDNMELREVMWPGYLVDGKKLSETASVNKSTLRYWTDKGLLDYRRQGGKFLYPLDDNLQRIRYIIELQERREYHSLTEIKHRLERGEYARKPGAEPAKPEKPVWSETSEQKFDSLVRKAASNAITTYELSELDNLSVLRETAMNPPTEADRLDEEAKEAAFQKLMEALNDYSRSFDSKNKKG